MTGQDFPLDFCISDPYTVAVPEVQHADAVAWLC
jgi:hypothetical protein